MYIGCIRSKQYIMLICILFLIVFLSNNIFIFASKWVVISKFGDWEKTDPTHLITKSDNSNSSITIETRNITLGSYRTSFEIDLSGSGLIAGELILRISELNFTVKYFKSVKPSFLGLSNYVNSTLIIITPENTIALNGSSKPPFESRLNNRIYIWLWRSGEHNVTWVVSDGYLQKVSEYVKRKIGSIYLTGNITYNGEPITIQIICRKIVIQGSGKLDAPIILNDVDSSGKIYSKYELKTLDYGFNALFYASLSFFILVIVGQILHKMLLREMGLLKKVKVSKKRVTRTKRKKKK